MTAFARNERQQLADLLLRVGPDEPTLCVGWTTRDLAAHLVVRERRPDASAGVILPPLAAHGERVRAALATRPFPEIVEEIRNPPWWSPVSNPWLDEVTNTVEFFIHHEDVRRGKDGWQPRDLDEPHARAIWKAARFTGKIALSRRVRIPVRVREANGFGEFTVGGESPQITLTGAAGELALFLSGRQRASRVVLAGPAEQAERLRTARLAI
ncbi:TIGR03085 family metal-binding protein [Paractinoplanes globisporus]|uniref:TIGR03085 family metal-binding protein n=1 Tax=Paractinoplanes globisporus TaxID=113565 RepID=A0ABW6WI95_9ACTN|nr:TIGR03085 family metal-binding protein [Actinoplanes globisporus]